ncbi:MAG: ATP-dependent helicase [Treponemataceae bacterium]|nr:ATP-dependent helicase [Treponemataceae bacterium]
MDSYEYLSVLNPEQMAAVVHEGSPLLILAGAGSGKTRVITTKIAYLIAEQGYRPSSILAVTFTKKAAREMQERAQLLESQAARSQIRTFHSFGSWFLRIHAEEAGIDKNFTVYDDDDMVTLVMKAVPNIAKKQASTIAHKISMAKDYCMTPDDPNLIQIESDAEFPEQYAAYEERLRATGNVDFGDLIMLPVLLLQNNESVRNHMHKIFKVIMVDEYQDSNVAQFKLLKALTGPDTYVCVVGDDDQSIYSFRGAEVQNILDFEKEFPGTQVIKLERNYRSVAPVLSIADGVVKRNKKRLGKTLVSVRGDGKKPKLVFLSNQDDEAAFAAEMILQSHGKGVPYSDWAILYRTNAQSLGFETEFLHRKIPYSVVGSLKFYEREEVKDALAYLAFLVNPRDEIAFRRIVNKPPRGIGGVTQEKLVTRAREENENSLVGQVNLLDTCRGEVGSLSKKAKEGMKAFIDLFDTMIQTLTSAETRDDNTPIEQLAEDAREAVKDGEPNVVSGDELPDWVTEAMAASEPAPLGESDKRLSDVIEKMIKDSGLLELHQSQDEISGTQRVFNLQELVNSASMYPANVDGLLEFLDHIELDRTLETPDDETPSDAVTLITLHNTKGLEYPRVIITGMEYGVFPRRDKVDTELEEERRLFYVGITRARDELYLTSCAYRRMYGRTEDQEISPFLLEIAPSEIDVLGTKPTAYKRFERQQAASGNGGGGGPGGEALVEQDGLASRWKKGRTVYHDDYGHGVILFTDTTESGEYVIDVQFETGTRKKFLPKYQANRLMLEM